VFGVGEYYSDTLAGRKLLAHELTHVVQQNGELNLVSPRKTAENTISDSKELGVVSPEFVVQQQRVAIKQSIIQRFTTCESEEDCPSRARGEVRRSTIQPMGLHSMTSGARGILLSNFAVDHSNIRGDLSANPNWNSFVSQVQANPNITWEILGFTDCHGEERLNSNLRTLRATELYFALPAPAQGQIETYSGAPISNCVRDNSSEANRKLNRSAMIRQKTTRHQFEDERVEVPAPPRCGPEITSNLRRVLSSVDPFFHGLTRFRKWRSCMALTPFAPTIGVNPLMAWNVRDLFLPNTGILDPYFSRHSCGSPRNPLCPSDPTRRSCETPTTTCGNSVLVGGKCMLAGTANYALWGKLCRLCHDARFTTPTTLPLFFTRSGLQGLIRIWKAVPIGGIVPLDVPHRTWEAFPLSGSLTGAGKLVGERINKIEDQVF
jgi:hypothetical protein